MLIDTIKKTFKRVDEGECLEKCDKIDEIVEAKMKTMKGMKKASMLGLIRELLEENLHNMSDDALVDEVYDMRKLGVMK